MCSAVKHYGYCISRHCVDRLCSAFEPTVGQELECLHCGCSRKVHLCVGISIGTEILDLSHVRPVERYYSWEIDERVFKTRSTSTQESLTTASTDSIAETVFETGPSADKTPSLSRFRTPLSQAYFDGLRHQDGGLTLHGLRHEAYGPDESSWPKHDSPRVTTGTRTLTEKATSSSTKVMSVTGKRKL